MKNILPLKSILVAAALLASMASQAQYYYARCLEPGNPGGINKDSDVIFAPLGPPAGSTTLVTYNYANQYTLQYTPTQTIPFTFNFNGGPVSTYKISTSGYITFSKISSVPTGPSNVALPTATLPDSSICVWGLGGASDGGKVYTKVYGTSPNRQLWIVYWFAGNPSDTNSQNVLAIVLEETSNNIYLVDEWGAITNAANGKYNPINMTMGVQVNNATAYSVPGSPNVQSITYMNGIGDNVWYEFSPAVLPVYTPQVKMPVLEEFTQASCHPCFLAMPNLDSVMYNNKAIVNPIRYHVWYPGVDCMDSVSLNGVVGPRASTYYNVSGVPYARLDGSNYIYPGAIRSLEVQDARAIGSPFSISIISATYFEGINKYVAKAAITAYHTMPANLVAQAMITVDTISYTKDQSTEDPGNNSPYLLKFPEVAEGMLPDYNGTALPAFTSIGQTDTIIVSWTKSYPWSADKKNYPYDSTGEHIVVFIQNNATQYIYQSANAPITNVISGINEAENGIDYINIYPNPSNGNTNIAFGLEQDENVSVEVYNLLGEKVYSATEGKMVSGHHTITVEATNMQSGLYFVRFSTDKGNVTKRMVIQK